MSFKRGAFGQRALLVVGITATVVVTFLLLWYAIYALLLLFASILLAVSLYALGSWLSRHTRLPYGASLALVVLTLIIILSGLVLLLAPRVATQAQQLASDIPQSLRQLESYVGQFAWGEQIIDKTPSAEELLGDKSDVMSRAGGLFSTTFGVLSSVFIILIIGVFIAADPHLYIGGILRLVPVGGRDRAREVIDALGHTLRWWLMGQALSMALLGVSTSIALWLLGVPLAMTLGLITALLTFIPNLGPIIASVPILLLALLQGPTTALYVLIVYTIIQFVEGNILIPLVMQRAVSLPPALTIAAQVFMGTLTGPLGLLLATPLVAVAMVTIRMLYVEDTLGDEVQPLHETGGDDEGIGDAGG